MHCIVLFCLSENRTGKKKKLINKKWQNHIPASWFQKGCILGGTCLSTVLMRNWYSREDILIWNTLSRVYRQKQKDISYGLDRCHSFSQPLSPSGMQWVVTRRRYMQLTHTCSACDLGFFLFYVYFNMYWKHISWLITLQTCNCITNTRIIDIHVCIT